MSQRERQNIQCDSSPEASDIITSFDIVRPDRRLVEAQPLPGATESRSACPLLSDSEVITLARMLMEVSRWPPICRPGSHAGLNWGWTIEESHDGGYYEYMVEPKNWIDYKGDEF
jgi:hypothetical protein